MSRNSKSGGGGKRKRRDSTPEPDEEEEDYVIERILGRRLLEGSADQYEYYIKWLGYDREEDNTWQTVDMLPSVKYWLVDFNRAEGVKEELEGLKRSIATAAKVKDSTAVEKVPEEGVNLNPDLESGAEKVSTPSGSAAVNPVIAIYSPKDAHHLDDPNATPPEQQVTDEVRALKRAVETRGWEITKLKSELDAAKAGQGLAADKLVKKKKELKESKKNLAAKEDRIGYLEKENLELKKKLPKKEGEIILIRQDLDKARHEVEDMRKELSRKDAQMDSLSQGIKDKGKEIEHLTKRLSQSGNPSGPELISENSALKLEVGDKNSEINELRTKLLRSAVRNRWDKWTKLQKEAKELELRNAHDEIKQLKDLLLAAGINPPASSESDRDSIETVSTVPSNYSDSKSDIQNMQPKPHESARDQLMDSTGTGSAGVKKVEVDQKPASQSSVQPHSTSTGSRQTATFSGPRSHKNAVAAKEKLTKENNSLKSKLQDKDKRIEELKAELKTMKGSRRQMETQLGTNELQELSKERDQAKKDLKTMEEKYTILGRKLKEIRLEKDQLAKSLSEKDKQLKSTEDSDESMRDTLFKQEDRHDQEIRALSRSSNHNQPEMKNQENAKNQVQQLRAQAATHIQENLKLTSEKQKLIEDKVELAKSLAETKGRLFTLEQELNNLRTAHHTRLGNLKDRELEVAKLKRDLANLQANYDEIDKKSGLQRKLDAILNSKRKQAMNPQGGNQQIQIQVNSPKLEKRLSQEDNRAGGGGGGSPRNPIQEGHNGGGDPQGHGQGPVGGSGSTMNQFGDFSHDSKWSNK